MHCVEQIFLLEKGKMACASVLFLLLVASALCQDQTSLKTENVTISPPDIYPSNSTSYVGEVTVTLVANQPEADVFYTKTGETPTNTSRLYTGPFSLFEPGVWVIQAVAIPRSPGALFNSVVVTRIYTVLKAEVSIPSSMPSKGKYRGSVMITLALPESLEDRDGVKIQYVVDVDDPGNTWQTFSAPFILDTPGEHIVKARVVVGNGSSAKHSPTARYRYEITPPLVYDVTTECVKCAETPTVGKTFTIWLQNPEANSIMFLTTSSKGCEKKKHMLDDTDYVPIRFRQVAYRFVTYTEPQPKVYVCLQEPSHPNATFITVPRRIKASAQGSTEAFFAIDPAFGAVKRQATEVPSFSGTSQPFSNAGGFSVAFLLVFGLLVTALGATVITLGKMMGGKGYQRASRSAPTDESV